MHSGAEQLFSPVRVSHGRLICICADIGIGIFIRRLHTVVYCVIQQSFIEQFFPLVTVEGRAEVDGRMREAAWYVQVHAYLSGISFFSRDQYDAIGGAGTIQGSRCRIFDYSHVFNIRRIQCTHYIGLGVVHICCIRTTGTHTPGSNWYSINDKQRFLWSVERSHSSDANTLVGTRLTGTAGYLYTGSHTLQLLLNAHHRHFFQHICTQRIGRSCERGFGEITIPCYYYLVNIHRFGDQYYFEFFLFAGDAYFLCLHSHIRYDQHLGSGFHGQLKLTVDIGNHSFGGIPLYTDGGTDKWFIILWWYNNTGYVQLLSGCIRNTQQTKQ